MQRYGKNTLASESVGDVFPWIRWYEVEPGALIAAKSLVTPGEGNLPYVSLL